MKVWYRGGPATLISLSGDDAVIRVDGYECSNTVPRWEIKPHPVAAADAPGVKLSAQNIARALRVARPIGGASQKDEIIYEALRNAEWLVSEVRRLDAERDKGTIE